jgi:hypothetical protein
MNSNDKLLFDKKCKNDQLNGLVFISLSKAKTSYSLN